MTSPALMIASGAALTGGGRQVGALLIAELKTSPNNCEILAFNEAPSAPLVEEGEDRRCILCDPDQETQDDRSDPAPVAPAASGHAAVALARRVTHRQGTRPQAVGVFPAARRRGDRITVRFGALHMSAYGTKRTCQQRRAMSAFGGKADIGYLKCSLWSMCCASLTAINRG